MDEFTRRRFLVLVPAAVGLGALPAVLTGCGGSSGTPIDGTVAVQNGEATLLFSQFPKLQPVGGAAVVSASNGADYLVVHTGDMQAAAFTAVCTHAHCLVGYDAGARRLVCPCHGSEYSTDGVVLKGPAIAPLATFAATLVATGITIKVG